MAVGCWLPLLPAPRLLCWARHARSPQPLPRLLCSLARNRLGARHDSLPAELAEVRCLRCHLLVLVIAAVDGAVC